MKKLLLLILFSSSIFSELPPYVYEELQTNAPESLSILVKKVKTSFSLLPFSEKKVEVNAEVLSVFRSKSRLKKGDLITIIYSTVTRRPPGWVGPSSISVLKENQTYNAYLKKEKDTDIYTPAARGKSFE